MQSFQHRSILVRTPVASVALSLCIAVQSSANASAFQDVTPPVILSGPTLFPNPNPAVPLAAIIPLTTDEPSQVTLTIDDGVNLWSVVADPVFATVHRTLALGLRPNRTHTIQVTVSDSSGNAATSPAILTYSTPPLPVHFPMLEVHTNPQAQHEPGVTLFNAFYSTHNNPMMVSGTFLTMVDENGEVVWFYDSGIVIPDVNRMRNGHFIVYTGNRLAEEIDILGNIVHQWWASGLGVTGAPAGATLVPIDTFHHELDQTPLGEPADFIGLTTELRVYPNYPADEINQTQTDPTANVIGDVIVEWNRDGTIVRKVKLLDILDPYRVCYGSLTGFYDTTYGMPTHDWGHSNAVFIDESDDTYVISLRHQDAVVKIRRDNEQIVWILGPHELWNPPYSAHLLTPLSGPFEWNYHQHGPAFNSHGNLILFDNGNFRTTPPAIAPPPNEWYSRVGEYQINASALTVRQLWTLGGRFDPFTPTWFSGFLGESDSLPITDNVLVTSGAQGDPNVVNQTLSRIEEVTRTRPAIQLLEVVVRDQPGSTLPLNYNVYRSERLPSVYFEQ